MIDCFKALYYNLGVYIMKYNQNINFVPDFDIEFALKEYNVIGDERIRQIFTLSHPSAHTIIDRKTFFDAVLHTFPLDPLILQPKSYNSDVIRDSVQGGLVKLETELIDVIWYEVDKVSDISVPTLIEGSNFILDVLAHFVDFFWGRRNIYTRLLLVYKKDHPNFSGGGWLSEKKLDS